MQEKDHIFAELPRPAGTPIRGSVRSHRGFSRKGWPALTIATGVMAAVGAFPHMAYADTPGCSISNHCYSVLRAGNGDSTLYAGVYGTWNRAQMVSGCSDTVPRRGMASTQWFWPPANDGLGWVEAGHLAGYVNPGRSGDCDYWAYAAWQKQDGSGYEAHVLARLNHNDTVTDEFQISKSATTNRFNVYFNGSRTTTDDVQFWNSRRIQIGGEIVTPAGSSHLFEMKGRAITQGGSFVDLPGPQNEIQIDPQDVLTGNSPSSSTWNWRVRP